MGFPACCVTCPGGGGAGPLTRPYPRIHCRPDNLPHPTPLQGLLAATAGEVTRRLLDAEAADDFSRQHLANFIWALATLEHDPGG